jgi:redox-sensitive bicupin YhaK (pirin superfamily)
MIELRKSEQRGHADHGWLDTHHTFSFADYYDPNFMGYRSLRVINEDHVAPGQGFGAHPHRDMEIITYVLEGALEHKDSMGNRGIIRPGDVQRMSAGTGVRHSEFNHSKNEAVHLLQIWILPERSGIEPSYGQKAFSEAERAGQLRLIAAREPHDGAVKIHQDARVYASILQKGESVSHSLAAGRGAYVQVARGEVTINGKPLHAGDGAVVEGDPKLEIAHAGEGKTEFLLFDLA